MELPNDLPEALYANLTEGLTAAEEYRGAQVTRWWKRAAELRDRKAALHASLPEDTRKVLEGENLLLIKEVLAEAGHGDVDLVSDLVAGLPVLGEIPEAGVFPPKKRSSTRQSIEQEHSATAVETVNGEMFQFLVDWLGAHNQTTGMKLYTAEC